ncbi:MAG: hypothetical protein Fur0044_49980 [Anaerolineae bacterium]|nr:hypothetical protein [Anaerolineales bacterium]MCQ3976773.1 hypothetical protein [Anaerolineae bacterium]
MATSPTYVIIPLSAELAEELPPDPATRTEVLSIGLQQWRVRQALEAYRRGEGTLAYAAQQAGVSIRQIIPLAYAYGLSPKVDPAWLAEELSLDQATQL